jgi:hypothetical protein
MAKDRFTPQKFMARYGASLVLVFVTYNPSGWSYFHWITAEEITRLPMLVLVGLMLLGCFMIFLRATMRSIGPVGIILSLAVLGALIWLLADIGLVDLAQGSVLTVVLELVLATVMAVGISWSHIRRRLSGQLDVDDTDE